MLQLDSEKSGAQFESWRLTSNPVPAPLQTSLVSPPYVLKQPGSGYIQVRAAVQHNHLHACAEDMLAFSRDEAGSVLTPLDPFQASKRQQNFQVSPTIPEAQKARLNASVVAVETPSGPSGCRLASTGQGDLHHFQDSCIPGAQSPAVSAVSCSPS